MTNQPVIRVDALRKKFRDREVLAGVSFEVPAGQTFAFLGVNAAGKTTTIRMLLGLLTPDSGSVSVLGTDPQQNPLAVRRSVGYLAEDQHMFGWMTVEQIVRFVAPFYDTWDASLAGSTCSSSKCRSIKRSSTFPKVRTCGLGWCWRWPIARPW